MTKADELEQIGALTREELEFLSVHQCLLCGQTLDRPGCPSDGYRCNSLNRMTRRRACLNTMRRPSNARNY